MAEQICPPLGTGSVDMNALHEAARKNRPLDAALESATTRVLPEANLEPSPPAAPSPDLDPVENAG